MRNLRKNSSKLVLLIGILFFAIRYVGFSADFNEFSPPRWLKNSISKMEDELTKKYGATQAERISRGLKQVAMFWTKNDGSEKDFEDFVRANFCGDSKTLDTVFDRLQNRFEALDGYFNEINYEFRKQIDLDLGEVLPIDEIFAGYAIGAHINEDFFNNKIAFAILLNFPLTTLNERLEQGKNWTRKQWAQTRLASRFSSRVPAEVNLEISKALADGELYTSEYKLWMHNVLSENGERLFPKGMNLVAHWNLRDEIKANYRDPQGLIKQRIIQKVFERIVTQTIPAAVINNPAVDWNPFSNLTRLTDSPDTPETHSKLEKIVDLSKREPDTRYEKLLNIFNAIRKADKYCPLYPTYIVRKFNEERQISEQTVETMLDELLSSPLLNSTARLIQKRLGRPLEPFDIWYDGFKPGLTMKESELNAIVSKKFTSAEAFRNLMPEILVKLGFSAEQAEYLRQNIMVEASRGSGHAMGNAKRGLPVRLRTRVGQNGMDYKGFNIAMHEMGHNIEQVFSLNKVDYVLLAGVPNNAITEAIAYVFQDRDLQALGINAADKNSVALNTLQTYWMTCEIGAVALVEMRIWRWLYEHPKATAQELKEATLKIAKDVWNKYYAPIMNKKDVVLLAVYSHMFFTPLYLADYPLGHLVSFQIEEKLHNTSEFGKEIQRMTSYGNLTPDLWMINATAKPLSTKPLLKATEKALNQLEGN